MAHRGAPFAAEHSGSHADVVCACSAPRQRILFIWVRAGPLATANREPRQARKGAAVTEMPGAGMRLARALSHNAASRYNQRPEAGFK